MPAEPGSSVAGSAPRLTFVASFDPPESEVTVSAFFEEAESASGTVRAQNYIGQLSEVTDPESSDIVREAASQLSETATLSLDAQRETIGGPAALQRSPAPSPRMEQANPEARNPPERESRSADTQGTTF